MQPENTITLDKIESLSCGFQRIVTGRNYNSYKGEILIVNKIVRTLTNYIENLHEVEDLYSCTDKLDTLTRVYQRVITSDKSNEFITDSFRDRLLLEIDKYIQ